MIDVTSLPAADVFPNFTAVDGAGQLKTVIGALLTVVLIAAVAMLVLCAITWALFSAHGNYQAATKARTGVLVALGTAALAGAGVAWMNFLLHLGTSL